MTTSTSPAWISADELNARLGFAEATRALTAALLGGLDPAADPPRGIVDVTAGQLLIMPAEFDGYVGVKLASVAPGNSARQLQRIQGIYTLLDATTLTPIAQMDGIALTTLRTAAVSAVAADVLAPEKLDHLVVFGSGPQAWGHVTALRAIRPVEHVTVVARDHDRAAALVERLADDRMSACVGTPAAVREAAAVVCATTARSPLFPDEVPDDAVVIAVGSHEPEARELPGELVARSQLVVENVATALREAGDVIIPVEQGALDPGALVPMRAVVRGEVTVDRNRPRVFKSVGMSWEDLVVAAAVHDACRGPRSAAPVPPPAPTPATTTG